MVFRKSKHHLTRTIRFPHKDADSGADLATKKTICIHENPDLQFLTSSSRSFDMTGITTVKGPKTYYATYSTLRNNSLLGNLDFTIGPFAHNLKLGEGEMNLDKVRIITKIKINCNSNVNSDILYPTLQSNTSDKSIPDTSSYMHHIEGFRLNPSGFVGFNIYKITKDQWADRHYRTKVQDLLTNESLFKSGTFYHSEQPDEADNLSWAFKKGEDLILFPKFDFFHVVNASYVIHNGKQAISVKSPYYQYVVDLNYFDI